MKEVEGECSECGKPIEEGKIGLCEQCFIDKYHFKPNSEGANY